MCFAEKYSDCVVLPHSWNFMNLSNSNFNSLYKLLLKFPINQRPAKMKACHLYYSFTAAIKKRRKYPSSIFGKLSICVYMSTIR